MIFPGRFSSYKHRTFTRDIVLAGKAVDLRWIHEQLTSENVRKVEDILRRKKSKYSAIVDELKSSVLMAVREAEKYAMLLGPLEEHIKVRTLLTIEDACFRYCRLPK